MREYTRSEGQKSNESNFRSPSLWSTLDLLPFILYSLFPFFNQFSSSHNQLYVRKLLQRCYASNVSSLIFSYKRLANVRWSVGLRVVWCGWWVGVVVVYREDCRLSPIWAGVNWRGLARPVTNANTPFFSAVQLGLVRLEPLFPETTQRSHRSPARKANATGLQHRCSQKGVPVSGSADSSQAF